MGKFGRPSVEEPAPETRTESLAPATTTRSASRLSDRFFLFESAITL
jgi:hypothetical protein